MLYVLVKLVYQQTIYDDEIVNAIPDNRSEATSFSLNDLNAKLRAKSVVVNVSLQKRLAHTDVQVPDFTSYRKSVTKDPNKSNDKSMDERRGFTYLATATFGVGAAIGGKAAIRDLCSILSPAKEVLALSKIEINLDDIPVGKNVTFKWRGKPIFVKHRSEEEIKRESEVEISNLRDPQADSDRVQRPEWLVLLGVCTHLGCVPIAGAGEFHGYFCPCHGSHYDGSGRIRKGPAPLNLEIPEHEFKDNILVIG